MMQSKRLFFIHGMFVTPLCWEEWLVLFRERGYDCLAPAWPGREEAVEVLRKRHPDAQLGQLTLTHIVDHYVKLIGQLDEKPVVIGHSMGGLIAQILLQRDLVAAAVAIDSAPPAGVFTTAWSFLRSNWTMINPFISASKPHLMTFEHFQYSFVHTMPLAKQRAAYEKYMVPESRQIPRESLGGIGKLDFKKAHAPLLLIGGADDHIIPASLNQANFRKYQNGSSLTDFKVFPGRTHFIIGQDGWQEVAEFVLQWLKSRG